MDSVQYFLQIYIDDINNDTDLRKYAAKIHRWLQQHSIDTVFDKCPEYGIFILETMQKYWCRIYDSFDSKLLENAENALNSLRLQRNKHSERENWMRQSTMACIFDTGYRGYD